METNLIWILIFALCAAAVIIIYLLYKAFLRLKQHGETISDIKRSFVTKQELSVVRDEFTSSIKTLTEDIKEIKDNSLTKSDFYRVQAQTDSKIDKIYDLLLSKTERRL